jgi:rod shape determining protein RodA
VRSKRLNPVLQPNIGWVAVAAAIVLALVGVEAIDAAPKRNAPETAATKQAVFMGVGLIAMLITAWVRHRQIGRWTIALLVLAVGLLVMVLLPLPQSIVPTINGARRWINLRIAYFQPSELAKVVYILVFAQYLCASQNYRSIKGLMLPFAITFVPMILILKEPDLGTSMVFPPVFLAMLTAAGAKMRHILMIVTLGLALALPVLVLELKYPNKTILVKPHQKARVLDWWARLTDDESYAQGISFQGRTALRLVGAGGIKGHSTSYSHDLARYNHLPEAHTDMVFSMICLRRGGVVGGVGVLLLYMIVIGSALYAAMMNRDPFARLVAVGVAAAFFTQVTVNIAMTLGLLPITGMTLPFMSYGGSSLVISFIMVGLILNVASHRDRGSVGREAFEYDGRRD